MIIAICVFFLIFVIYIVFDFANNSVEKKVFKKNEPIKAKNLKEKTKKGLSVTKFAKQIKQPRGGFLKAKEMTVTIIDDKTSLSENENVNPVLIGIAVDYLTRYLIFEDKESSFHISLMGAYLADEIDFAHELLDKINANLDNETITSALKLSGYDVVCRNPGHFNGVDGIEPNDETIKNVSIMVNRSVEFFKNKRVIDYGMTFLGAYNEKISSGDADYLTIDTIFDMKVSKHEPNKNMTMQLIIYYIMIMNSIKYKFYNIEKIGIFNPRMNKCYEMEVSKISEVIQYVEKMINE